MRRVLLYHGLPLLIACAIIYLSGSIIKATLISNDSQQVSDKFTFPGYFDNYQDNQSLEDSICRTLWNGSLIVVMGSSEMTTRQFKAMPYNIFNCVGLGHEGNQCFSMYAQLCAMNRHIQNAKLVIILSPGWFCGDDSKGSSTETFLEFNDDRFLYNAYYSTNLDDTFKTYIGEYLKDKMPEIKSPSAIIKAFYYDDLSSATIAHQFLCTPYKYMYDKYCMYKVGRAMKLAENEYSLPANSVNVKQEYTPYELPKMQKPNWDSLYVLASKEFVLKSNNNSLAVDNDYYTTRIKNHKLGHLHIVSESRNKELTDFKMLVKFLKKYNVNTYFIIQPLNPYTYDNLQELTPLLTEVKTELSKNSFTYYDMYTADTTHYQKGILTDVMHLGNLGWYKADSAIYTHFYK
jgi:D-alanine transfer protein